MGFVNKVDDLPINSILLEAFYVSSISSTLNCEYVWLSPQITKIGLKYTERFNSFFNPKYLPKLEELENTNLSALSRIGNSKVYDIKTLNIARNTYVDFVIPQIVGFRYKLRIENGYVDFVGYLMKSGDNSSAREIEPNIVTGEVETLYTNDDLSVGRNVLRFYSLGVKDSAKIVISLDSFETKKYPKTMAVIGDSFSAYPGFVPEGYECWYPQNPSINNVQSVTDMWWYKFATQTGCRIADRNESISGTCVCKTTRPTQETLSFVDRVSLMKDAELFIIEGGTNDQAVSAPMGDYKYSDWTSADLFNFRPALAYVIDYIKKHFTGADILFMMNDDLSDTLKTSITTICGYYNVRLFAMQSISKQGGHPSIDGHTQICNQLIDLLDKNIGFNKL